LKIFCIIQHFSGSSAHGKEVVRPYFHRYECEDHPERYQGKNLWFEVLMDFFVHPDLHETVLWVRLLDFPEVFLQILDRDKLLLPF
jgi:hypothetical protein